MRFDPKEPGRNMRLHENGSFFQEDGLMARTGSARQIAALKEVFSVRQYDRIYSGICSKPKAPFASCTHRGAFFMIKIAIYGKGGIGKSTVTSHLAAAFATLGKRVIQIGCDPKADSTINLLGGQPLRPVMNYLREEDEDPETLEEISRVGFGGILCIETGGPTPGLGCAGRGIIATFQLLEDLRLFETWKPDVVLYDVLGDVVCGGFAAPIREGYAEQVLIVTSGEKMALYAANNIASAVENFEDRSYARIRGIILNHRNVVGEDEKVRAFADSRGLEIIGEIPRSDDITRFEDRGMTTVEGDPDLPVSRTFLELAKKLSVRKED